jgi:hypothetical protein
MVNPLGIPLSGKEEGTMMICRYQAYKYWAALFFAGAVASLVMK